MDDHEPAHVHVIKAGQEVVINLGSKEARPRVRENRGMRTQDKRKALILAGDYQESLLSKWRDIHG